VPRGGITGLIGPNGAGKSNRAGHDSGPIKPSRGSVLLNGTNIAGWPSHKIARRGLARTFQQSGDFSGMTVMENLLTARYGQRGDTLRGALLGSRYWRAEQESLTARAADLIAASTWPGWRTSSPEASAAASGGCSRSYARS
jgi:ABC-type branched-subunit amino acid transport system ATPase component